MPSKLDTKISHALGRGLVIPACPLALTSQRAWDERRQSALFRYYFAAGAGGLAVGVHFTQFAIRDPRYNLFRPLLELAAQEMNRADQSGEVPAVRVAGVVGRTNQAVAEAALVQSLGYHLALLNLSAMTDCTEAELLDHCREVSQILPLFGFYLQPSLGGLVLSFSFWRRFAEIENVAAIKVAPFNRYQTLDVVRAVAETGRDDIAFYTGNDDTILLDLLTPYRFRIGGRLVERRIVGGLLGQWAIGTHRAVEMLDECHRVADQGSDIPAELMRRAIELTDFNAAVFDAANNYTGCIPGVHEILRRQGLLESIVCLNPKEKLSPGQVEEIDRVCAAYPHLNDDEFVRGHLEEWLGG
jgi:dihydrodipicolinate synthase/N-acetylneuraminate lyase